MMGTYCTYAFSNLLSLNFPDLFGFYVFFVVVVLVSGYCSSPIKNHKVKVT